MENTHPNTRTRNPKNLLQGMVLGIFIYACIFIALNLIFLVLHLASSQAALGNLFLLAPVLIVWIVFGTRSDTLLLNLVVRVYWKMLQSGLFLDDWPLENA